LEGNQVGTVSELHSARRTPAREEIRREMWKKFHFLLSSVGFNMHGNTRTGSKTNFAMAINHGSERGKTRQCLARVIVFDLAQNWIEIYVIREA
jgi:hypothetical protein